MTIMDEEQNKAAPGPLALVQAFVNTQYGQQRRAYVKLTSPEELRAWLGAQDLLADGTPVTEGECRRCLLLPEPLPSLLRANNEPGLQPSRVEVRNQPASSAPRTLRSH